MSQSSSKQAPPPDVARQKRRSLAEGPAFQEALAETEKEARESQGWKLLDGPPQAPAAGTVDHTQPEANWRVEQAPSKVDAAAGAAALRSLVHQQAKQKPKAVATSKPAPAATKPPATSNPAVTSTTPPASGAKALPAPPDTTDAGVEPAAPPLKATATAKPTALIKAPVDAAAKPTPPSKPAKPAAAPSKPAKPAAAPIKAGAARAKPTKLPAVASTGAPDATLSSGDAPTKATDAQAEPPLEGALPPSDAAPTNRDDVPAQAPEPTQAKLPAPAAARPPAPVRRPAGTTHAAGKAPIPRPKLAPAAGASAAPESVEAEPTAPVLQEANLAAPSAAEVASTPEETNLVAPESARDVAPPTLRAATSQPLAAAQPEASATHVAPAAVEATHPPPIPAAPITKAVAAEAAATPTATATPEAAATPAATDGATTVANAPKATPQHTQPQPRSLVPLELAGTMLAPPGGVQWTPPVNHQPIPAVALAEAKSEPARFTASSTPALESPAAKPRTTSWLTGIAIVGLAAGIGLGQLGVRWFLADRAGSTSAQVPSPAPAPAAPDAPTPKAEAPSAPAPNADATSVPTAGAGTPNAATAAAATPSPAPSTPSPAPEPNGAPAAASSDDAGAIPWLDQPTTSTEPCAALAGPDFRKFPVEKSIKNGLEGLMRGDAQAAHVAFCRAEQLGAQNTTVFMGLAQVQLMQSDLGGALRTLDRELALRPSNSGAYELRGDVLIRLGRQEEAQQAWLKALGATRATDALLQNLLRASRTAAQAALRAGDLARADRVLRRAIALAPRDRQLSLELAAVLEKNQRPAAAARWKAYAATLGS